MTINSAQEKKNTVLIWKKATNPVLGEGGKGNVVGAKATCILLEGGREGQQIRTVVLLKREGKGRKKD